MAILPARPYRGVMGMTWDIAIDLVRALAWPAALAIGMARVAIIAGTAYVAREEVKRDYRDGRNHA